MARIAHWSFNEAPGSGTAVDNETGDGVAQNGTYENGATTTGTGQGVFDGVNDYVEVPTDTAFDLATGSVVISFTQDTASAGDRPFGTPVAQTLFSLDATGFGNGGHLSIFIKSDGSVGVRHQTENANFDFEGGSVTLGQPTTIAYTWSPTGSQLIVDGVVVDTGTDALVLTADPQPITIGASQAVGSDGVVDNPVGFFDGTIDAVAIYDNAVPPSTIPCFAAGTMIATQDGDIAVEKLKVGQLVRTGNNQFKPIRWIGSRRIDLSDAGTPFNLRPVHICAGAMGKGLPQNDLWVSRQHRMLVSSKIAQRMFDCPSVLIPAIKLTGMPGISVDTTLMAVEYFHILFDDHEIIFAEGTPTESLYPGNETMKSLTSAARHELMSILPALKNLSFEQPPTLPVPEGSSQKRLVARHVKNDKALLEAFDGSVL